jgi:hypothetical protein
MEVLMKRICAFIVFSFVICFLQYSQEQNTDEVIIKGLLAQVSDMWTAENGILIFRRITSDDYRYYANNVVLTKDEFDKAIVQLIKIDKPIKHIHAIINMQITGKIAYEYGKLEMTLRDGSIRKQDVINVFSKEQDGWKLKANIDVDSMKEILN